jgi:hypothetical protein
MVTKKWTERKNISMSNFLQIFLQIQLILLKNASYQSKKRTYYIVRVER